MQLVGERLEVVGGECDVAALATEASQRVQPIGESMWARHSRAQQRAADPMTPRRGPEAGTNCKRQPRSPAAHRLKTAAEGHSTHQHSLTGRPSLTHGVPPLLLGHEQCSVIHKPKPPRMPGGGPHTATDLVSAARTTYGGWPLTTTRWRRWRKSSPAPPIRRPSTASICPTPGNSKDDGRWGSGLRRWPPLTSDRPTPLCDKKTAFCLLACRS